MHEVYLMCFVKSASSIPGTCFRLIFFFFYLFEGRAVHEVCLISVMSLSESRTY